MESNSKLIGFLLRTLLFALSVLIAAHLFRGIQVDSFGTAVVVALVYGLLNFIAYYLLGLITIPFGWLTLGVGFWIINTILLLLSSAFVSGFHVNGFLWALFASAAIAVLNCILSAFVKTMIKD
jgi:putative membrane protein